MLTAVALGGVLAWLLRGELQLDRLIEREVELLRWRDDHFWLAIFLAGAVYALVTGLSIPGATLLTLVTGWLFGFGPGLVVVSLASTAGATLAFLFARWVLKAGVPEAAQERLRGLGLWRESLSERQASELLLVLRLVPLVPFFVVNLLMAALPIRATRFWWISQLGMLPATVLYVLAGSSLPGLKQLQERGWSSLVDQRLLWALAGLGALAGMAFWYRERIRRKAI
ncbi:MAG: TVP38/TMEM64 family protein [Planctomycetota bacterium]